MCPPGWINSRSRRPRSTPFPPGQARGRRWQCERTARRLRRSGTTFASVHWIGSPTSACAQPLVRQPQGHSTRRRSSFTGIISTSTCCGVPGRLPGVVDWPHAAVGSRGSDVGHCRLDLAVLFDAQTADDYLARYERAADVTVDRRADLRALLCFDRDWQRFIPLQVAGRAPLDVAGMPAGSPAPFAMLSTRSANNTIYLKVRGC